MLLSKLVPKKRCCKYWVLLSIFSL
jgi:hypothetical protein